MSNNITGGNAPTGITQAETAQGASSAQNPLSFAAKDQGSTTSELLRGQIEKLRMAPAPQAQSAVAFHDNAKPSLAVQSLMTKLQAASA